MTDFSCSKTILWHKTTHEGIIYEKPQALPYMWSNQSEPFYLLIINILSFFLKDTVHTREDR